MKLFLVAVLLWAQFAYCALREITLTPRNSVILAGDIHPIYMASLTKELFDKYENLSGSETLYLVILSGGGLVDAAKYFMIRARTIPALEVVIVVASSAAAMISQHAAQNRLICKNGVLVFHHSFTSVSEKTAKELSRFLEGFKQRSDEFDAYCGYRLNLTKEEYAQKIDGKDWVISSKEALKIKAVDEEVLVTCDPELEKKNPMVQAQSKYAPAGLVSFCQVLKQIQKRN